MPDPVELSSEMCVRLVRAGVVGRVALCAPDGPHVVPLNYSVVDDAVVLRTSPYSILGTHGRGALLAFEVDHIDQVGQEPQHSWSVVVRGRCEWLDDATAIARVEAIWAPRPWASGSRPLYLRLPMTTVSGRRLGLHREPLEELSVRRASAENVPSPDDEGPVRR